MLESKFIFLSTVLLVITFAIGCSSDVEPIAFGKDQCNFCRMTISNPKFGAELITDKGRILKYDAAECMINHLKKDAPKYRQMLAIAYDRPRELFPVDLLHFVITPHYRSPMGANLAGFESVTSIDESIGSKVLSWQEVERELGLD
ncbi:hypothetical protein FNH22_22620 [Fulvivirga sp. M361]|uniref:hypothetical protein n=1 Tax=Fulvivirga sp. M361 TaxID=2594266 RepID=UPI001179F9F5|nr:hypothetical protein [Fulvivirga sp. M361]TRX52215.1 hypothetical protein FNH22_22620 [Fulvivirga sp. M361]